MQELKGLSRDLPTMRCPTASLCIRTIQADMRGILQAAPANYLTSPGLGWNTMLRMTNIEVELISDVDMLSMIARQNEAASAI